jgi:hypothetical protein
MPYSCSFAAMAVRRLGVLSRSDTLEALRVLLASGTASADNIRHHHHRC